PHVLQPEVAGQLVDSPGPGGVRRVREPHRVPPSIRYRIDTVAYRGSAVNPENENEIDNGSPRPHTPHQLGRRRAPGPRRWRPGRRANREARTGARRDQGRLLLALRRPAR